MQEPLGHRARPANSGLKQTRISLTLDPRSLALVRWPDEALGCWWRELRFDSKVKVGPDS